MAYYSLPKMQPPAPQVPTRVENNRARRSLQLQQEQAGMAQRQVEIEAQMGQRQALQQAMFMPQPMGGLPGFVPQQQQRPMGGLPGFDRGGEVNTEDEQGREREEPNWNLGIAGAFAATPPPPPANFVPGVQLDPSQIDDRRFQVPPMMGGREDIPLRSDDTLRGYLNYERGYRIPDPYIPPDFARGGRVYSRMPGFADGGDVFTGGGWDYGEGAETEEEKLQRFLAEQEAIRAQPTYTEKVQQVFAQNPELAQIRAGEMQANNADANLAQMRAVQDQQQAQQLQEMARQSGATQVNPNQAGFREPGVNPPNLQPGPNADLLGKVVEPALNLADKAWQQTQFDIPVVSPVLRAVKPELTEMIESGGPLGYIPNKAMDLAGAPERLDLPYLPDVPLRFQGPAGMVSNVSQSLGGPSYGQFATDVSIGQGQAGDLALLFAPKIGDIPLADDAIRNLAHSRVGQGVASRLPGIMEGLRGGEAGMARLGGGDTGGGWFSRPNRGDLPPITPPAAGSLEELAQSVRESRTQAGFDELVQSVLESRTRAGAEDILRQSAPPPNAGLLPQSTPSGVTPPGPGTEQGMFSRGPLPQPQQTWQPGPQGGFEGAQRLMEGMPPPAAGMPSPPPGALTGQPGLPTPPGAIPPAQGVLGQPPQGSLPGIGNLPWNGPQSPGPLGQPSLPGMPPPSPPLSPSQPGIPPGQAGLPEPAVPPPGGQGGLLPGTLSQRMDDLMRQAPTTAPTPAPLPFPARAPTPPAAPPAPPGPTPPQLPSQRLAIPPLSKRAIGPEPRPNDVKLLSPEQKLEQARLLGINLDEGVLAKGTPLARALEDSKLQQATDAHIQKGLEAKAQSAAEESRAAISGQTLPPKAPDRVLPPAIEASLHNLPPEVQVGLWDWINVPRTLMTGIDYSYPLRQGVALIRHQQEFWPAFKKGFDAVFDEKVAAEVELAIKNNPRVDLKKELDITLGKKDTLGREEAFAGMGAVGKIPIVGPTIERLYGPWARANEVFINKFRSDVADTFIDKIQRFEARKSLSPSEAKHNIDQYMRTINYATMRGSLGRFNKNASELGQVFFSLRSALSRPQLIGQLIDRPFTPAWNEAVMDITAFLGAGYLTLELAEMAGAKVNYDPRSTDFGKIVVGNRHIDIWGGYQQIARTMYQAASGQAISSSGKLRDVDATSLSFKDNPLLGFLRNKLSPQATEVANTFWEDEFHKPTVSFEKGLRNPSVNEGEILKRMLPLLVQDIWDGWKDDKLAGALLATPTFFGVGGQTYESRTSPLGERRAEVKGDPSLPEEIRDADFNKLGPDGKAAQDKVAEAKDPEGFKADQEKQRENEDPAFTKNREVKEQINSEEVQRKDALLEAMRSGRLSGGDVREARTIIESAANARRDAARNDPELKKATDAIEKNDVSKALDVFYAIQDQYKKPDGKTDYPAAQAKQAEFLLHMEKTDPETAKYLMYEVNTHKAPTNALDEIYAVAQPTISKYFGEVKDVTARENLRRGNPADDALLNLLGYANKTLTPEAGTILKNMRDTLPAPGAAAPVAAGGTRGNSAPAPAAAAAPPPAPAAAPASSNFVFPVQGYSGKVNTHWDTGEKGGTDIFATRGTPVLAMDGGKVVSVGTDKAGSLGGNNVTIRGNDGRDYYYAHGDRVPAVAVGQVVPAGQFLFGVGDSGNAKGKGTHLHIGIGYGIQSGSGPQGGSGKDFDAVGHLAAAQGKGAPPPAPAGGGGVRGMSAPLPPTQAAPADLRAYGSSAAQRNGIDPAMFQKLIMHESSWNPDAVNKTSGAAGLGQMLPSTAKGYGVTTDQLRQDPNLALDLSARMLGEARQYYKGDQQKAVASYFAGMGNVDKAVRAGGGRWLEELDRDFARYKQGTVSAYLRSVGL